MSFWQLENLRSVLSGNWLVRPGANARSEAQGASIDTRSLKRGNIFFALKGEKVDGHKFLGAAEKAGAALAVVEDASGASGVAEGLPIVQVESVGAALLRCAGEYRRTLEGTRVVSIGGSNGKTTTSRLVESVLSRHFRGVSSPKSFNNAIGVPLTILSARKGDQYLVCEVGTNEKGEIAQLASVVNPEIAVITSIGREHLEGLSSVQGVLEEEAAIASEIRAGGVAIIADQPVELGDVVRGLMLGGKRGSMLRFGMTEEADLRVGSVATDELGTSFSINERAQFRVPLLGAHNALNGAAAVAVARRFGLDDTVIRTALAEAATPEMRMRLESHGPITILNDAYNANPDSMLAALKAFSVLARQRNPARRVVVLADMLEMGDAGPDAHREIGEAVASDQSIDFVVLAGPLMMFAAERVRKKWAGERVVNLPRMDDEHARRIASMLKPGDFVLLKGSRGMGVERVARALDSAGSPLRTTQETGV
ncbi:MAG: UDP-N-acetylmuramoyl-tripeptide--D-alanyl-D-alanine ligase [Phycisphaeraceae bacterium]|nr:UDP-N-acetylmuramoyl-tripeptide--D-alanyl-D-alanine ligase [Phycisphaeraceae bacterium]